MGKAIFDMVAQLGWKVDDKQLDKFKNGVSRVSDIMKKVALAATAATAAIVGMTIITNKETAQQDRMAKALGLSAETYEALGGVLGQLGLDAEIAGDLMEEMNNKIGEGEENTALIDSLDVLGIKFKNLKKLKPEDQFLKIASSIDRLADPSQAASISDAIFGGEANKFFSHVWKSEKSLKGLLKAQKKLNFQNKKSRKGAEESTAAFEELATQVVSIKDAFFGLLGGALTPLIKGLSNLLKANKKLIQSKLEEWTEKVRKGIEKLIKWFKKLYDDYFTDEKIEEYKEEWKELKESLKDTWEEIKKVWERLGELYNDYLSDEKLDEYTEKWEEIKEIFKVLAPFILGIAAAYGVWKTATMVLTAKQWLLNTALAANPIGLIILAVAAAIGVMVFASVQVLKNWDKIMERFIKLEGFINRTANAFKDLFGFDWEERILKPNIAGEKPKSFNFVPPDIQDKIDEMDKMMRSLPKFDLRIPDYIPMSPVGAGGPTSINNNYKINISNTQDMDEKKLVKEIDNRINEKTRLSSLNATSGEDY